MKKILIFIILTLLFFISALDAKEMNKKELTFVQITDIHIDNNTALLDKMIDEINTISDVDFVLFGGDNIDKTTIENFKLFLKSIKRIKAKTYVTIGNHDVFKSSGLDKLTYMKEIKRILGFYHSDKPHYVINTGEIVFICPDGTKEVFPAPNGYFNKTELDWLDKNLAKYKDKKVVILQHYPLLLSISPSHNLWHREDYFNVLKKHNNVIAIVSGHYHKNEEKMMDGIYHIVTSAAKGGNYKIITIDKENFNISTSLININ